MGFKGGQHYIGMFSWWTDTGGECWLKQVFLSIETWSFILIQVKRTNTCSYRIGSSIAFKQIELALKKSTMILVWPGQTQISLRIRTAWSKSSLITCAFHSLWTTERGIQENPCHTLWMYRLIWGFAGHSGLIVGFVVRWIKYSHSCIETK